MTSLTTGGTSSIKGKGWRGTPPRLQGSSKFIGLANFTSLLKEPVFWQTFFQTVVWTVASVGLALVFGVAAGLSLRSVKRRSG